MNQNYLSYNEIIQQIDKFDSYKYARSRNFLEGHVSRLSAYISRGVISVPQIIDRIIKTKKKSISEKWIQQLIWREFWQQQWFLIGEGINNDPLNKKNGFRTRDLPVALLKAKTGIDVIDKSIVDLKTDGYMHNHMRLYVAALVCNISQIHWFGAAIWMYYYLLDGDWGSNALSWRWVAGTDRSRKYWMNQDNINKYTMTKQKNTFLDYAYEDLINKDIPDSLKATGVFETNQSINAYESDQLDVHQDICIYTSYTLDPNWMTEKAVQRVLLLEPSHFENYPVSDQVLSFIVGLAKHIIPDLLLFIGDFKTLKKQCPAVKIYFKEHPFSSHLKGVMTKREFLVPLQGPETRYFKYYERIKKMYFK